MKIDYSIPEGAAYWVFLDSNVQFGVRHINLAVAAWPPLSVGERITHFVLGLLMLLPLIGHAVAAIDYALYGDIEVVEFDQESPYERGKFVGERFKAEIGMIYGFIETHIQQRNRQSLDIENRFNSSLEGLQQYIGDNIIVEMQGLADGAGVTLEQVFRVHTFLDIFAGEQGCSALGAISTEQENRPMQKIAVTNHFHGYELCDTLFDSFSRLESLQNFRSTENSLDYKNALRSVNQNYTIQSVIFNTTSKQVHLATGQVSAAHTFFRTFSLFGEQEARVDKAAILARNLDWPWGFLAPYTILVRTHSDGEKRGFVNVTFPGFIGVLTGMNDQGVALACCQSGQNRQTPGEPVTLLFRRVLEHAATADEAGLLLGSGDTISASSMNLVVVAPDRAFAVELDPARRRQGSAAIHFAV